MRLPKRPQNECLKKSCQYTWYPRGKDLSNKCPECGSKAVQIVQRTVADDNTLFGCFIVFVVLIFGIYSLFFNTSQPSKTTKKIEKEKQKKVTSKPKLEKIKKKPWHELAYVYLKNISKEEQIEIAGIIIREISKKNPDCRFTGINAKKVEFKEQDIKFKLFIGVAYGKAPVRDLQKRSYYTLTWNFNKNGHISSKIKPAQSIEGLRLNKDIRNWVNERLIEYFLKLKVKLKVNKVKNKKR